MAWIETIPPEDADGRLARIYGRVQSSSGQVDAILQAHSLRPRTLEGHLALYKAALHSLPSELSPRDKELMGVIVSELNACDYCVEHHKAGFAAYLDDPDEADAWVSEAMGRTDPAHLDDRLRAMVRYTRKLTRAPLEMGRSDIDDLRDHGLSDAAILELNQVVAYFAYANRTVLGLGVEIGSERLGEHPPASEDENVRHA